MSNIYEIPQQCIMEPSKVHPEPPFISIGFDHSEGSDIPVLAVFTTQFGMGFKLLNVFQGEEASDIYEKLTGWRFDKECSKCNNPDL